MLTPRIEGGFTLWNRTLRTLSAMESSVINSTMLIQIAILAWLLLGEQLTHQGVVGMVLAGLGVLLVQLRRLKRWPHGIVAGCLLVAIFSSIMQSVDHEWRETC